MKTEAIPLVNRASSAEEYFRQRKQTSMVAELFNKLSDADREKAEREILKALRPFEKNGGFEAPGESLLVVGSKL